MVRSRFPGWILCATGVSALATGALLILDGGWKAWVGIIVGGIGLLFVLGGIVQTTTGVAMISTPRVRDEVAKEEIMTLLRDQKELEAIKRYGELAGVGLEVAKAAVEELQAGRGWEAAAKQEILVLLRHGDKMHCGRAGIVV